MKILIVCPLEFEYKIAKQIFNPTIQINYYNLNIVCGHIDENEIYIIKSGLGKTRSCIAAISGIEHFQPDFVLDTGSCGGILDTLSPGDIIIGYQCFEYDISGYGLPKKKQKMMEIHSGFNKNIEKKIQDLYNKRRIITGIQASGEFIIKDSKNKMLLRDLFDADACNWESSGVFLGALSRRKPCLSIRVVSDLADENLFSEYPKNIQGGLLDLYGFIKQAVQQKMFYTLLKLWNPERIQVH
jgi:5'-methylthioadenosine/S-adenosylhomocysteine nucleosidase